MGRRGDRGRCELSNARVEVEGEQEVESSRSVTLRRPQAAVGVIDPCAQRVAVKPRHHAREIGVYVSRERAAVTGTADPFVEHARQRVQALALERVRPVSGTGESSTMRATPCGYSRAYIPATRPP